LYILSTDDLKSTYKQILYTTLERSPSAALLRIIFFVETQRDTILLRDDLVRWLRGMNRWSNIGIHEKYFCPVYIVDRY
jgi:hypothetical protein